MRSNARLLLVLSLCAALMTAVPVAVAQEAPDADVGTGASVGPTGRWWSNPRIAARLGLTAEQTRQIDDITFTAGQKMIDLRAQVQKSRLDLARLLQADQLDQPAIDRTAGKLIDAQGAVTKEEVLSRVKVAGVLTREQRVNLAAWFERRADGPRPLGGPRRLRR